MLRCGLARWCVRNTVCYVFLARSVLWCGIVVFCVVLVLSDVLDVVHGVVLYGFG